MKRSRLKKRLKRVAYRFIPPEGEHGPNMYALLQQLVRAHHEEIAGARIALAWNLTWQPDVDGRVTLGQCRKVGDLEREVNDLRPYDFVIVLRREFWENPYVTDLQHRALLDHELTHATVALDGHGEPMQDECGRTVYRLKRHDIEEFTAIVERYGIYKKDLEDFAAALTRARHTEAWIGYDRVRERLAAVGVEVTLEMVVGWTETQRREADTWAHLQGQVQELGVEIACPPHVAAEIPATQSV